MSDTSARASLFALNPGSRARNGLIGRRSPGTGVFEPVGAGEGAAAGDAGAAAGGVTGGTDIGAAAACHGVAGVVRIGGSDAPSEGILTPGGWTG